MSHCTYLLGHFALGCGKSTLASDLAVSPLSFAFYILVLSLDDFYYSFDEQQQLHLTKDNPNALLQGRGPPGTHDIALIISTLYRLKRAKLEHHTAAIHLPRYDKSLQNGFGDRYYEELQVSDDGRPWLVILEGWFIGFSDSVLSSSLTHNLLEIQSRLTEYQPIWQEIDIFIFIRISDYECIHDWRWEQECSLHRTQPTRNVLLRDQVFQLVNRCLPIYHNFCPIMTAKPCIFLELDKARRIIHLSRSPINVP